MDLKARKLCECNLHCLYCVCVPNVSGDGKGMVICVKNNSIKIERCTTISKIQKILGGKWKIEILYYVSLRTRRFGELQRQIGDITPSTLTKQLRELEADGFISRYIYQEIPPKVEYSLTDLGKSFVPILEHMKQWGKDNLYQEQEED